MMEQSFPLQLMMKDHDEAGCSLAVQISTCSPWNGLHAGAGGYLKEAAIPWEPTLEQAPARTCRSMETEAHTRAGLPEGLVTLWGTHAGAAYSWRTAPSGKDSLRGSLWRAAARGKDMLRQFVENSLPWEGPHAGAGEECEESSAWGGRSSKDNVWWTDHNPHSPSPWAARGEEVKKWEWSWAQEEGRGGEKVFKDQVLFLTILLWFDWWWIKLPFLPKLSLFGPWQQLVSDLSLSLSRPSSLSSYFLSPVQLRRGSDGAVLVGTCHSSRPNQSTWTEKWGGGGREKHVFLRFLAYFPEKRKLK